MTNWNDRITNACQQRREQSLWRSRVLIKSPQRVHVEIDGRIVTNFCSNDYLNLASDETGSLAKASQKWGFGSGASHLVCGHSQAHHDLEQALAHHVGYPKALLFSNGFSANLALISALTKRNDLIIQDKLNHASLIDGAQLSQGQLMRYRHLDIEHLKSLISKHESDERATLVVSDSVFSMDGDIAEIDQLVQICQPDHRLLMVDDAHGFGVLGAHGEGVRNAFDITANDLPIYMGTLGKALGGYGAFVAANDDIIDYLVQFARPYVYSTALPPALAEAMIDQLEKLQRGDRQQRLNDNINLFKKLAYQYELPIVASDTAIQPLMIGESQEALNISQQLLDDGLWVSAIRPPTVPNNSARLRITITSGHSDSDIKKLVLSLHRILSAREIHE